MGNLREAVPEHLKALAIRQKLADDNPIPQFQRELCAASRKSVTSWRRPEKRAMRSVVSYVKKRSGRRLRKDARQPSPIGIRWRSARLTRRSHYVGWGGLTKCLPHGRALVVREPLVQVHPEVQDYRTSLCDTYLRLGQIRCDLKNLAGAALTWRRACRHDRVEQVAGRTGRIPPGLLPRGLGGARGPTGLGGLRCGGADQAEKAMTLLRQAVTMGYRNPEAYRTDSRA